MTYENIRKGRFLERPNRFIAYVEIDGVTETVHVKNTGRCRELLLPGSEVWCQEFDNPKRKTRFDLYAVRKGKLLINMDSQAPNKAAMEWLKAGGLGPIQNLRAEVQKGDSRFDFAFNQNGQPCFLEVKGVTLEENGVVRFPDAPTERGAKHLRGLAQAAQEGCGAYVLFVVQMENVLYFEPNHQTDPAFAQALFQAAKAGVHILVYDCRVTVQSMDIGRQVALRLG